MAIETPFTETVESLYDQVSKNHAKTKLWSNAGYPMSDRRYITSEEPSAWYEVMEDLSKVFRAAHVFNQTSAINELRDYADKWDRRAYVQAYGQPERAYKWAAKEARAIVEEFAKV